MKQLAIGLLSIGTLMMLGVIILSLLGDGEGLGFFILVTLGMMGLIALLQRKD